MTPDPNTSNFGPPPAGGPQHLANPAIGVIVGGSLGLLVGLAQVLSGVMQLTGGGSNPAFGDPDLPPALKSYLAFAASGGISLVLAGVVLAVNAFIVFGGLKMRAAQSYGPSVAAAALCCVPCCFHSCCTIVVIPLGIWALVLLLGAQGKSSFTS